jgi:hypothetical protein
MKKKDYLERGLALFGTIFVLLPVLAPLFFTVVSLLIDGRFRLDYLMPAELFPLALLGAILLLAASLWSHMRRSVIGWGIGIALASLAAGMVLSQVSGLATGETEPTGWIMAVVLVPLAAYTLAIVVIGVGGILLLRDLFRPGMQA